MNWLTGFVLFGTIMISMCQDPNWLNGLLGDINKMNVNLQSNLQRMNQQIHSDVQARLSQVDKLKETLHKRIANLNQHTMTLASNGESIVVTGNGEMKTLLSGRNSNGQTYFRESEDKIVGDTLIHTEKIYIPTIKSTKEFKYNVNLKNPNAEPVVID